MSELILLRGSTALAASHGMRALVIGDERAPYRREVDALGLAHVTTEYWTLDGLDGRHFDDMVTDAQEALGHGVDLADTALAALLKEAAAVCSAIVLWYAGLAAADLEIVGDVHALLKIVEDGVRQPRAEIFVHYMAAGPV